MSLNATYTTTTPAFRLTTTPDAGTALPLTDPSQYGNRPLAAFLQATVHDIRFTTDGSAPTSSHGAVLVAGNDPFLYTGPLVDLRFIQAESGSVLNVIYGSITDTVGPQGPPGPTGATGPAGEAGVVQSVVAGDNITVDDTDPANPIVAASGGGGGAPAGSPGDVQTNLDDVSFGALGYTPANKALVSPTTFLSSGTPGDYILAKSGIVVKNGDGDEVFRIWGTDPNSDNYNAQNLYIGWQAGLNQTTNNSDSGSYNIGIGAQALQSNTTGGSNIVVGPYSMPVNTTGDRNVVIGLQAMESNVDGRKNVAIADGALDQNISGYGNVAVGVFGLYYSTANKNTAVGIAALSALVDGENNVMVGGVVGDNTAEGYPAIIHGSGNTVLGFNAGPSSVDTSNSIAIGSGADVSASNRAVIGNVSVTDAYFGSESAAAKLHAADFLAGATSIVPLRGVTGAISGALTLGAVNTGTATVTGAAVGMVAVATPTTYPGNLVTWMAYVSAADTVTVVESGLGVVTPTSTTFQVAVFR